MHVLDITKPLVMNLQSLVGRVRRGVTFGVRGVVIDGDRVYLVKHSYVPGWYLPGGGVEPGETAVEALARELKEEGNIDVLGAPTLLGLYFNREAAARDHVALYRVDAWRQEKKPRLNHEIIAAAFFPIADLPADATKATRRRVAELAGTPASVEW